MQAEGIYANRFLKRMQKKLMLLFLFILLILCGIIGRLMYIEETSGEKYEKIILSQQAYDNRAIPFKRGDIVDARGNILATSVDVYNVVLDCWVLNQTKEDRDKTVAALVECFPELKSEEIYQTIKEKKESRYQVLLKRCPYEQVREFTELREASAEEAEKRKKSKTSDTEESGEISENAVWFEKEYVRRYPYDSLAASLIGFVSSGDVGTIGLENYYNSTLNGVNGREYGYLNADNNFEKTTRQPKDGHTLVSTIHQPIQAAVEEKLAKYCEENTNGYVQGDGCLHIAAIVMNPQNGDVYAMANNPTFDLNQPRDPSLYFTEEELAGRSEEEKLELLNKLWENFCVTYTYEPGSTMKPMTVACGLETGTLSGDEAYVCDGVEVINGSEVHCVNRAGHGTETVQQALMDSCNDALMQMSYSIGQENFTEYQNIFGFGQRTGIDLPGEERGLLNSSKKALDLATNSFGQNFNCTMIQLASAFCSLINGGKYYQPHVVKRILDSEGNVVENIKPVVLKETVSKQTSEKIKSYLFATVSEGTGHEAKVDGYSMGGKTGTAQKLPRDAKTYLVSFVGYVPQENPQLMIYLIIDEPNVKEQAHSSYAQGVAKEILEEILPYLNIYPDEELTQEPEDGQDPEGSGTPEDGQTPEGSGTPEDGQTPEGSGTPEDGQTPEGGEPPGDEYGDIFEE